LLARLPPPIRRSADPPIRRSADPPIRRSADPPIRRSADPPVLRVSRSEDGREHLASRQQRYLMQI
jgi:hypothetical protein